MFKFTIAHSIGFGLLGKVSRIKTPRKLGIFNFLTYPIISRFVSPLSEGISSPYTFMVVGGVRNRHRISLLIVACHHKKYFHREGGYDIGLIDCTRDVLIPLQ